MPFGRGVITTSSLVDLPSPCIWIPRIHPSVRPGMIWSSRCHEDGFGATSTWPSTGTVTSTSEPNGWVFLGSWAVGCWRMVGDGQFPENTNGYIFTPKWLVGLGNGIFPFEKIKVPFLWHSMLDFWGVHFVKLSNSRLHIFWRNLPPKGSNKIMRSKNHEISSHWWELEVQSWTLRKTESFNPLFRRVPADS